MGNFFATLTISAAIAIFTLPASAELGSDVPSDDQLLTQRIEEAGTSGSGIFDIASPPDGQIFSPVNRVPRDRFGVVGRFRCNCRTSMHWSTLTPPSPSARRSSKA
jgi:hypothetical protein